jgi:VanZ family protein
VLGPAGRAWTSVGVWWVVQTALTTIPGADLPPLPATWGDLAAHAAIYGLLGMLVARAAVRSGWPARRQRWAWVVIACWAGLDEAHQLLVPGRSAEVLDWVADGVGAGLGLAFGNLMVTRIRAGSWMA